MTKPGEIEVIYTCWDDGIWLYCPKCADIVGPDSPGAAWQVSGKAFNPTVAELLGAVDLHRHVDTTS